MNRQPLVLNVNGADVELFVSVHKTLLEVVREDLDLTGTKHGCELGECGACAVLIDQQPILSCLALPIENQAPARILTVEGLADRLLMSTDYPHHDSPFPNGVDMFLGHVGISDADKRKILWDNGARLFGLEVPQAADLATA